jgi:hypothetical protein
LLLLLLLLLLLEMAVTAAAPASHAEAVHLQCDLLAGPCELHSPGRQWGFQGEAVVECFSWLSFCSRKKAANTTAVESATSNLLQQMAL